MDAVPNKELFKYYNAADIGVWPLQCSVTMLEATACGLPAIISDRCGATERVAAGNGILPDTPLENIRIMLEEMTIHGAEIYKDNVK